MTTTHVHTPSCAPSPPPPPPAGPSAVRQAVTRSSAASLLAILAGVSAWVLVRNPLRETVFPPCPLHATTGLWCPGCGATRASYLLFRGDVASALHYNALWVVLAPFALYQAVAYFAEAFGVTWIRRISLSRPVIVGLLGALIGFGIVRNLPIDALEALNPVTAS